MPWPRGPQHQFTKRIPVSEQPFPFRCSSCALWQSQPAIPRRGGFMHWLSLEADRQWAPPRGRQASADRRQVAGCQETNPWVLLTENTEAESCLLQYLLRQFHLSLTHQLSADSALFKALTPRSPSPWIPIRKLCHITFSFSGASSLISLHSSFIFHCCACEHKTKLEEFVWKNR